MAQMPSFAKRPVLLSPVSRWVVSGDNWRCAASRAYGSATGMVAASFRLQPDGGIIVLVVGPPKPGSGGSDEQRFEQAAVVVGRSPKAYQSRLRIARTKANIYAERSLLRIALTEAAEGGELWLHSSSINYRFALPALAAVTALLEQCEQNLKAALGLPIAEQKRIAVRAKGALS